MCAHMQIRGNIKGKERYRCTRVWKLDSLCVPAFHCSLPFEVIGRGEKGERKVRGNGGGDQEQ